MSKYTKRKRSGEKAGHGMNVMTLSIESKKPDVAFFKKVVDALGKLGVLAKIEGAEDGSVRFSLFYYQHPNDPREKSCAVCGEDEVGRFSLDEFLCANGYCK